MAYRLRTVVWVLVLALAMGVPGAFAKVYIWEDAEGRTHYTNDAEDVPPEILEDDNKYRLIETTPRSGVGPAVRTPVVTPQVVTQPPPGASGTPQVVATPPSQAQQQLLALQKQYRDVINRMREYRQRSQDLNSPEYMSLQKELNDTRKQMAEARSQMAK